MDFTSIQPGELIALLVSQGCGHPPQEVEGVVQFIGDHGPAVAVRWGCVGTVLTVVTPETFVRKVAR